VKLLAIRQIEPLEKIALKRLRRLAQRVGRDGVRAVSGSVAQGQDVDRDKVMLEFDSLAVGDDHPTIRLIDERPQPGQTPAQCSARVIGNIPEHRAEPVAAVRTCGDGQIGEQSARLF
jgi:hypothetical protein